MSSNKYLLNIYCLHNLKSECKEKFEFCIQFYFFVTSHHSINYIKIMQKIVIKHNFGLK